MIKVKNPKLRNPKRFYYSIGKFLIQNYVVSIQRNKNNKHLKSLKIYGKLTHTKKRYKHHTLTRNNKAIKKNDKSNYHTKYPKKVRKNGKEIDIF